MEVVLWWVNFGRRLAPKVGHFCMPIDMKYAAWDKRPGKYLQRKQLKVTPWKGAVVMPEMRHNSRVSAKLSVHLRQEGNKLFSEYSVNLSTGGLFLETTTPLPEGTLLSLTFELPDKTVHCNAKVA